MTRLPLAAAVLLTTLAAPPAYGEPVTVRGLSCGMSSAVEGLGIHGNPTHYGLYVGGPVHVGGADVSDVAVGCTLYDDSAAVWQWAWHQLSSGPVLVESRAMVAQHDVSSLTLCTTVSWATSTGTEAATVRCAPVRKSLTTSVPFTPELYVVPEPFVVTT